MVLSKLGTTPYPGFRPGVQPHSGTADRPGQAWLGLWPSARAALDFFSSFSYTLRHHFARPHATAGSTAAFYFRTPYFVWLKKKDAPRPANPSRVSHIFCKIRWQKRGLGENFLIFAQGQQVAPVGQIASLTWSHRGAPFFPSPSYILRHHSARRHATAGSAAAFSIPGAPDPNAPWSRFYNNSWRANPRPDRSRSYASLVPTGYRTV